MAKIIGSDKPGEHELKSVEAAVLFQKNYTD